MPDTRVRVVLSLVLLVGTPWPLSAHSSSDTCGEQHVRITDERLRTLFEEGLSSSPTFRALVSRLEASDVVVYLQFDADAPSSLGGRLSFLSVVGGVRYVVVRVRRFGSAIQQLPMMAHELQHAVEVAERPEIVDGTTMFLEYSRIGYAKGLLGSGIAFDTKAAVEAGARVRDEMRSASRLSDDDEDAHAVSDAGDRPASLPPGRSAD